MTLDEMKELMAFAAQCNIDEFSVGDFRVRYGRYYDKSPAMQENAAKVFRMVPEEPEQAMTSAPSRVEVGITNQQDYSRDPLLELAMHPTKDLVVPERDKNEPT